MSENIGKYFQIWEETLLKEKDEKKYSSEFAGRMRNPSDSPSLLGYDAKNLNMPTPNFTSGPELEMVASLKLKIEELEKLAHAQFLGNHALESEKTVSMIQKMKEICDDLSSRFADKHMHILPPEQDKEEKSKS